MELSLKMYSEPNVEAEPAVSVLLLEYGSTTILRGGTAPPRKNFGKPRVPRPYGAEVSANTERSPFCLRRGLPEGWEDLKGREEPVRFCEGGLGFGIFLRGKQKKRVRKHSPSEQTAASEEGHRTHDPCVRDRAFPHFRTVYQMTWPTQLDAQQRGAVKNQLRFTPESNVEGIGGRAATGSPLVRLTPTSQQWSCAIQV
jgi:hypothetical protein